MLWVTRSSIRVNRAAAGWLIRRKVRVASLLGWVARRLGWESAGVNQGDPAIAYVMLSRIPGFRGALEPRICLLAGARAAELSGCRWCIERLRHEARLAGLSLARLEHLDEYARSPACAERERAALEFVDALAGETGDAAFLRARQYFTDNELATLAAIGVEHHCTERLAVTPDLL